MYSIHLIFKLNTTIHLFIFYFYPSYILPFYIFLFSSILLLIFLTSFFFLLPLLSGYFFFFLMIRRPPRSPLFPYPPLFRSSSTPRSSAMRAMTGGSFARNFAASLSGASCCGFKRTSHVLSFAPGNEPPPTSDSPATRSASLPTPLCNASAR